MLYIATFIIGAVLGFLSSWFVYRNNKKKWAAVEAKYNYVSDNLKTTKDIWSKKDINDKNA